MTPSRDVDRYVASSPILRTFIKEIAEKSEGLASRELEQQIEAQLKKFLRENPADGDFGNWARMGISKEEAMKIESLYDDLPYMKKVQKWVMENVTLLSREVKPSVARNAYNKIVGKSKALFDPYKGLSDDVAAQVMRRRDQTMPAHLRRDAGVVKPKSVKDEIVFKNERLNSVASDIVKDSRLKKQFAEGFQTSSSLAKTNPIAAKNIQESMESALDVYRATGLKSIGKGCDAFNKNISAPIAALKQEFDLVVNARVAMKAEQKAGRSFASFEEIPVGQRVTQAELDDARIEAFQDVLGYSKKEAQAAYKRLRSAPCQVY